MEKYLNKQHFETTKCIVYVGLTNTKANLLARDHNIYNEYRMSMTFIQRITCIHNEFEEKCGGIRQRLIMHFKMNVVWK